MIEIYENVQNIWLKKLLYERERMIMTYRGKHAEESILERRRIRLERIERLIKLYGDCCDDMRIYEKQDFKDLPDYFWELWLARLKEEIIITSYPLFLIRVGICHKKDEAQLYQKLWGIKEDKKDATFYYEWYKDDKYIGIQLNTIFDYSEKSVDDF